NRQGPDLTAERVPAVPRRRRDFILSGGDRRTIRFVHPPAKDHPACPHRLDSLQRNPSEAPMSAHFARSQRHAALDGLNDKRLLREQAYVDGHWTAGAAAESFEVTDPASGM